MKRFLLLTVFLLAATLPAKGRLHKQAQVSVKASKTLGTCYLGSTREIVKNVQGFNCQTALKCTTLESIHDKKTDTWKATRIDCCPTFIKITKNKRTISLENNGASINFPSDICIYSILALSDTLMCTIDNPCPAPKTK